MHKFTDRQHEKAVRHDHEPQRGNALDEVLCVCDINSELIGELRDELHERCNEIRNTELDTEQPENEEQREDAERRIAARDDDEAFDDRMRSEVVKSADDGIRPERDRTLLAGMNETAQSSVRRMEYLERERSTKERVAIERIPVTKMDADRFDFLLRRRSGEEEETAEDPHNKEDNE